MIKGVEKLIIKLDNIKDLDLSEALTKACLIVETSAKEKCPVDTGQLRNSITYEVEGNKGIIGTNVEYAPLTTGGG